MLFSSAQPPRSPNTSKIAILVVIFLAFGSGFLVASARNTEGGNVVNAAKTSVAPADLAKDADFPLFWEVWKEVKAHYVKQPVADLDLYHGAMRGMVASLNDPYSMYFEPKIADEFAKDLEGTFEGIGAEIGMKNDIITVIAPLPDSPASKAGIRAGDKIVSIDATSTYHMTVDQAVNFIRGEGGTKVTLTLLRVGKKEPFKAELTRAKIIVKSVKWEERTIGKSAMKIGWIQIRQFNDETTPLFAKAVNELQAKGVKGYVVDLRNNPGGYLDAAVNVASAWVEGPVVVEKKYDGTESTMNATAKAVLKGIPTIVLVNEGSASGAEIVAGALQDENAATLVGKKTFGKGSVQDYQELRDGGALKLTIAEWLTPKKRSINKLGIPPDIEVELTDENANADKDPQLEKAYELLEKGSNATSRAATITR